MLSIILKKINYFFLTDVYCLWFNCDLMYVQLFWRFYCVLWRFLAIVLHNDWINILLFSDYFLRNRLWSNHQLLRRWYVTTHYWILIVLFSVVFYFHWEGKYFYICQCCLNENSRGYCGRIYRKDNCKI